MSVYELRKEFENLPETQIMPKHRDEYGQYSFDSTRFFWVGYFTCAVKHGIIEIPEGEKMSEIIDA